MRRLIILLAVFIGFCAVMTAQNGNDILYLRDGTNIRGKVLNEVPGQTVEIQVGNEIFTYRSSDVTKIERAQSVYTPPQQQTGINLHPQQSSYPQQQSSYPQQQSSYPQQQSSYPQQQSSYPQQQSSYPQQQNYQGYTPESGYPAQQIYSQQYGAKPWVGNLTYSSYRPEGYRGFADLGYTPAIGEYKNDRISFTTSHGYQINPYFFVGAGAGFYYLVDKFYKELYYSSTTKSKTSNILVPVFVNMRANFVDGEISPYFDVKAGYSFFDCQGLFVNPSLGVSFAIGSGINLNAGIGYELFKIDMKLPADEKTKVSLNGLSLKFGVEF